MHRAIREHFPNLESKTAEGGGAGGEKVIQVFVGTDSKGSRRGWLSGRGSYCKFVLYKENKDTIDAIGTLAKQLR